MDYLPTRNEVRSLDTASLRENFLVDDLFGVGRVTLTATALDRAVVGSAVPLEDPLTLRSEIVAYDYFTSAREVGVMNIGGPGHVEVGREVHGLTNRDCLYVGRGGRDVRFFTEDEADPARYLLVSYPAHKEYPTAKISYEDALTVEIGSRSSASKRVIQKYIYPDGISSCQLMMGITELQSENVWNTMPPHVHSRRSEIYMYFGLEDDDIVCHIMGEPEETRSLIVRDGEAVLSPSWSIHSGCGTSSYSFCWAMGGENQVFDDLQMVESSELL